MSQENVEKIALQQVEAVNRGDAEALVATTSSDVEWEDSIFWSEGVRTYRGRAELRQWFTQVVVEPWESLHCGVEEIIKAPDERIFFGGLLSARGKDSGVETQLQFWTVSWLANGKITRRRVFRDREEALKAAGLRD